MSARTADDSETLHPQTPVLVGVGLTQQRLEDPAQALEPIALMIEAVRASGADSGVPGLPAQAALLAVPQGLWAYGDPGRMIARAIGAAGARTVLARIGVMQQSLIDQACSRIAAGEIEVALVVGGEARYRALRAQIAGGSAPETEDGGVPDLVLEPEAELYLDAEVRALGHMPVGYYAIIESAFRAARGWSPDEHRDRLAALYSRFSEIAAGNPHAWKRERLAPELIRNPSAANRMLAFPYTKLHNSSWNVDQASALLFCSAARARALGVPRERWVFPVASAESNHMLSLLQRPRLDRLPGAELTGRAVLQHAGLGVAELDWVELYSCFPIAVELYAAELGLPAGIDLTVTGGMPFAGGPLNNYLLHATGRMAELLRGREAGSGLVSSVSGLLTKQSFAVWSRRAPAEGFLCEDVTAQVAQAYPAARVVDRYTGTAVIQGCTVLYDGGRRRAAAVVALPDGARTMATADDPALLDAMEREEFCGRAIDIVDNHWGARHGS
jgi:acetyl-CoA C-acetyltransferase